MPTKRRFSLCGLTKGATRAYLTAENEHGRAPEGRCERSMKIRNSLKTLKNRHRENRMVRRKGRIYIINKTQKKFKVRQG